MNPDLIFSPLTVAVLVMVSVMAFFLSTRPAGSARAMNDRLESYFASGRRFAKKAAASSPPQEPFVRRVLIPVGRQIAQTLGRLMPPQTIEQINNQLTIAGRPANLTGLDFLGLRVLAAGLGLALGYLYGGNIPLPTQFKILAPFIGAFLGYMLPNTWLQGRMRSRREMIVRALPDALDMLTICVEAGLAFESAMQRVSEQWKGALSAELSRVVSEIRLGVPRPQALRRLAQRCDVPDVSSFVAVLVQADSMGTSIAQVLRSQADQIRVLRRQRAEEKANKAPMKVVMAMLLFIFPALFVVILGPAVPRIIEAFSHMGR